MNSTIKTRLTLPNILAMKDDFFCRQMELDSGGKDQDYPNSCSGSGFDPGPTLNVAIFVVVASVVVVAVVCFGTAL